jgi:acyl-ACP thioesterase
MNQPYETTARITYYDLDYRGKVKLSALLRMVHIAADVDANLLGVGHAVLTPLNMSFILQRFGLSVTRMPRYDETVTIRTWPSDVARGTFARLGDMYDSAGHKLMEWASLWVLLDIEQRKILRSSALPVTLPEFGDYGVRIRPQKIDLTVDDWGSPYSSYLHTVRYCEVDTNMHINNSVYGDLIGNALFLAAGDGVGNGGADGSDRARVQINYLAEAKLGEEIEIKCRREGGKFLVTGNSAKQSSVNGSSTATRGRVVFSALVEAEEG